MPEPIVTLNEESLKNDLSELVRGTVEDVPSGLLEEGTGDLAGVELVCVDGVEPERQGLRDGRLDSGGLPRRGAPGARRPLLPQRAGRCAKSKRPRVAAMLRAIRSTGSREAAEAEAPGVADGLEEDGLGEGAKAVGDGCAETPAYASFPPERRRRIRASNAIERLNREIRRRTRVVGTSPDGRPSPHARGREAQVRRRERAGLTSLSGRGAAGDVAAPDGGPMGCRRVRKDLDGNRS